MNGKGGKGNVEFHHLLLSNLTTVRREGEGRWKGAADWLRPAGPGFSNCSWSSIHSSVHRLGRASVDLSSLALHRHCVVQRGRYDTAAVRAVIEMRHGVHRPHQLSIKATAPAGAARPPGTQSHVVRVAVYLTPVMARSSNLADTATSQGNTSVRRRRLPDAERLLFATILRSTRL